MEDKKILIVDDEKEVLDYLVSFIQEIGKSKNNIIQTVSAEQAIELIDENNFDLIISDFKMPGMDGLQVLRYIRENKLSPKFILFSAYFSREMVDEARELKCEDFLVKGHFSDLKVLKSHIEKAIVSSEEK